MKNAKVDTLFMIDMKFVCLLTETRCKNHASLAILVMFKLKHINRAAKHITIRHRFLLLVIIY